MLFLLSLPYSPQLSDGAHEEATGREGFRQSLFHRLVDRLRPHLRHKRVALCRLFYGSQHRRVILYCTVCVYLLEDQPFGYIGKNLLPLVRIDEKQTRPLVVVHLRQDESSSFFETSDIDLNNEYQNLFRRISNYTSPSSLFAGGRLLCFPVIFRSGAFISSLS